MKMEISIGVLGAAFAVMAAMTMGCSGGATEPGAGQGSASSSQDVVGNEESETTDDSLSLSCGGPPSNARCVGCPNGLYKHVNGHATCGCCETAPAFTCGGPPSNARCRGCAGGYKHVNGQATCECCPVK